MGQAILNYEELLKLPLSYTAFSKMRRDGVIYVDKTEFVGRLGKIKAAPVFLSRPRRFGKSLLLSTFKSLFSTGLKDFKDLAIAGDEFWQKEKTYKVIHLDFSNYALKDLNTFESELSIELQCAIKGKERGDLTDAEKSIPPDGALRDYFRKNIYSSLVLLIDEYDSPITHNLNDPEKRKQMIDFISSFFATIKSCEGMFRFVFITGITRLAHVSLFSMFNNMEDIAVNEDYSSLLGITENELHACFDRYVRNAAAVLDMSVSDVYARLKSTYDGFQFAIGASQTVYNPWSLLSFLSKPKQGFANYWYSTSGSTPTLLVKYLQREDNLELFNMLRCRAISKSEQAISITNKTLLSKSEPDQIPLDILLYQAGYFSLLRIGKHRAKLVIPNDEIAESMIQISLDIQNLKPSDETCDRLDTLPETIDSEDLESVFSLFNAILLECVSCNSKAFSDENTIRDIIYALIPRDEVIKSKETMNSQGFSDLELKTRKTKLVIEFKRITDDGNEEEVIQKAFEQMKLRHYGETLEPQKLIRAAMVISSAQRRLTAWKRLPESPTDL